VKKSRISFLLTENECELLEGVVYLEPGIAEVLDNSVMEENKVRLKCEYEDLEECLETLSFVMAQSEGPNKKELRDLYEKLGGYLKLRPLVLNQIKAANNSTKKTKAANVYIFDVEMTHYPTEGKKAIRTIAIQGKKSLYQFAEAIIKAFDFFFDHCFAFYGDVNSHPSSRQEEIYELFVDIGEEPTATHAKGVKKTRVEKAFAGIGKTMMFMFDYGDDWRWSVTLKKIRPMLEGEKLPKVVKSVGNAPKQYPPCD